MRRMGETLLDLAAKDEDGGPPARLRGSDFLMNYWVQVIPEKGS